MNNVADIEAALQQLPRRDTWKIARWLLDYLEEHSEGDHPTETPPSGNGSPAVQVTTPVKLPDYAARRRRIFRDKVLPNMVLIAREEERW